MFYYSQKRKNPEKIYIYLSISFFFTFFISFFTNFSFSLSLSLPLSLSLCECVCLSVCVCVCVCVCLFICLSLSVRPLLSHVNTHSRGRSVMQIDILTETGPMRGCRYGPPPCSAQYRGYHPLVNVTWICASVSECTYIYIYIYIFTGEGETWSRRGFIVIANRFSTQRLSADQNLSMRRNLRQGGFSKSRK